MNKTGKWKKWSVIIPVLIAGVLLVSTPMAVLAQAKGEENPSHSDWKGSLAIVAPRVAPVNQEISMTVFLRWDQTPFEGAGVWVFTQDNAQALREEIATLGEGAGTSVEEDYEALADRHGTFLGRTGDDGKIYHTFETAGAYVLAAFRPGYFPGFTSIHAGERPDALAIRAPQRAPVGEDVTMAVYQRGTEETLEGAGVWAVSREKVELLKEELASLGEDSSTSVADRDYESIISIHGTFLGRTDKNGHLSHAFEDEGGYLLVAIRHGFLPGFAPIYIGTPPEARGLTIWAPLRALVDTDVEMTVYQRGIRETVEGAGIWAVTRSQLETLREKLSELKDDSAAATDEVDYESLVDSHGEFLGRTDGNGQLIHVFSEEGDYILVAVKRGYFPGFSPIRIVSLPLTVNPQRDGNTGNTRADILRQRGVPGEGISNAPGLQKASDLKLRPAKNNSRAKGLDKAPGLKKQMRQRPATANNPQNAQ